MTLSCFANLREERLRDETVQGGIAPARVGARFSSDDGLTEYKVQVSGQPERSAAVWLPEGSEPRFIVVLLHGAIVHAARGDGPERQSRELLRCLAVPALKSLNPVVLVPRSEEGRWWTQDDTSFVLGLLQAADERWPSAHHEHVVLGYSNGGIGAWYFARLYPDYFSAAVAIASNETIVGDSKVPVYAIHGSDDELFPIAPVRSAVNALSARGFDVTFAERTGAGHMEPCSYARELKAAAPWLERHILAH